MYSHILAAIALLAAPGSSPYSVVAVPECGTDPAAPACERRWNDVIPSPVNWSESHGFFVRQETREEAQARLALIARAIANVAAAAATPGEDGRSLWPWPARELADALVVIANHESGFRRDVHSGVGPAALGSGKDVCLVQIRTGGLDGERYGVRGRDLVGLDLASTERCFTAGARLLARARNACARQARGEGWFAPSVALYGSGASCSTKRAWVKARAATYRRVAAAGELPPEELLPFLRFDAGEEASGGRLLPVPRQERHVRYMGPSQLGQSS